jgi:hypothetical protein
MQSLGSSRVTVSGEDPKIRCHGELVEPWRAGFRTILRQAQDDTPHVMLNGVKHPRYPLMICLFGILRFTDEFGHAYL